VRTAAKSGNADKNLFSWLHRLSLSFEAAV
jgi:hypothetical protein